jgi:hypothetical protein
LREFIFDCEPQPFDLAVFPQYITGTPLRQQEGNLKRREAGPAIENVADWMEELWAACGIGCWVRRLRLARWAWEQRRLRQLNFGSMHADQWLTFLLALERDMFGWPATRPMDIGFRDGGTMPVSATAIVTALK